MIGVNDLLRLAIEGHGGTRRCQRISRFRVAASITGPIWALKGQPGLLDGLVLVAERRDPAASFAGTTRSSPWDEFQVAHSPASPRVARAFRVAKPWAHGAAPFVVIVAEADFVVR
jgi:hypothetical protein